MENMTDTYCNNSEEERMKIFLYDKKVPFTMRISTERLNPLHTTVGVCAKKNANNEIEIIGNPKVTFDIFEMTPMTKYYKSNEIAKKNIDKFYDDSIAFAKMTYDQNRGKKGGTLDIKICELVGEIKYVDDEYSKYQQDSKSEYSLNMLTVVTSKVEIDENSIKVNEFLENSINDIINQNTDKRTKTNNLFKKLRQFGYFVPLEVYYGGKFIYETNQLTKIDLTSDMQNFSFAVALGIKESDIGKFVMEKVDEKWKENKVKKLLGKKFYKQATKLAGYGITSGVQALITKILNTNVEKLYTELNIKYEKCNNEFKLSNLSKSIGTITCLGGGIKGALQIQASEIPRKISEFLNSLTLDNCMPVKVNRLVPIYNYFSQKTKEAFEPYRTEIEKRMTDINYEYFSNHSFIEEVRKNEEEHPKRAGTNDYVKGKDIDAGEIEKKYKQSYTPNTNKREPFQWPVGINDQGNGVLYHKLEAKKDFTALNYTYDKIEGSLEENEICVGWRIEGRWHDGTNGTWKCIIDPFLGRKWHFEFCSCFNRGLSFWLYIYYVNK